MLFLCLAGSQQWQPTSKLQALQALSSCQGGALPGQGSQLRLCQWGCEGRLGRTCCWPWRPSKQGGEGRVK